MAVIGQEGPGIQPLRPSDFLCAKPTSILSDIDNDTDVGEDRLRTLWHYGQTRLDAFWQQWVNSYFPTLRQRYTREFKPLQRQLDRPAQVGDIVLVKDDKLKRGQWSMAIIRSLIKSTDGEIRAAEVQMPSGRLSRRGILQLYPLELNDECDGGAAGNVATGANEE